MGINNPGSGSGVWTLLHDETLGVAGEFDVTGISQNHDNLKCVIFARSDAVATNRNIVLFLNGDETATNYRSSHEFEGSTVATVVADDSFVGNIPAASSTADYFSHYEVFLPFYTNDKFKTIRSYGGVRRDATVIYIVNAYIHWENTDAINQITIPAESANLVADSRLQIYGMT